MSFKDNATYGTVNIVGMEDKVYLNQSSYTEYNGSEEEDMRRYHCQLHCMALNEHEAISLINALIFWLNASRGKNYGLNKGKI